MASSKSQRLRELAQDRLIALLEKPEMSDDEFRKAQLFCRVVEAETNGGPYGLTTYINGDPRLLERAARAVPEVVS